MPTVLPTLAARALTDLEVLTDRLVSQIATHTADYRTSIRLDPAELRADCRRNLTVHLQVLAGGDDAPFVAASRDTGRARAALEMPLDAVLQAYRIGGRVLCEALVAQAGPDEGRALLREMPALWALVDRSSAEVAQAYGEVERRSSRRATQRRSQLVEALLAGDLDVLDARNAADQAGLPTTSDLAAVCIAEWPEDDAAPGRLLAEIGVRSAWAQTGRDLRGIAQAHPDLGRVLARHPTQVAVGPVCADVMALPESCRLAASLLPCLTAGEAMTVEEALPRLLLTAAPAVAVLLRQRVLGPLDDLQAADREDLLATVTAYVSGGCSTRAAAMTLGCHRNTVAQRLGRLVQVTGRPLDPAHLLELQLALLPGAPAHLGDAR